MSMIRILLADDHHLVRHGLRMLLEAESGFCVVGEAQDGIEALDILETLQPDVAVIDLVMPRLNGLEVARQAGKRSPLTKVVMLSMYDNEAYVLEALRSGAKAYVLKSSTSSDLVQAIRAAVAGRRYLSPPLSQQAIKAYTKKTATTVLDSPQLLTTREQQVLQMAAEGFTNADIAARLSVSPRTVETHRTNLMNKLGLRTRTELIRYALRHGILPMES